MILDDALPCDPDSPPAPSTEEGSPHSGCHWTHDDLNLEPVSELDIEESLRVLDEIWPRDKSHEEQFPRRFGRFAILGELGRGGFGVVYLAGDPLLGRKVALKVPRVEVFCGNESWRRFLREAKAASRLDHPNLIPLLEADTIGPVGYIVTAFVPGPSLEQWLKRNRGGGAPRWAARLVATLARAMEHAHQRDILHRDLKPANVMLHAPECEHDAPGQRGWEGGRVESWTPRICDFGLAKLREIEVDETKSRIACGSPPYMAPEQAEARRQDIGPETDVYGLGAILYELLTGKPPFAGKSDLETLVQVVTDEPAAPRKLRPAVPRDLETICLKCLSKRPENRYRGAAALAQDLERYLEGRPIQARPLPIWARGWRWARRKPALAALATAAVLAVVVAMGELLWHESVLRGVNERLRRSYEQLTIVNERLRVEARRAEDNAVDALQQRSRAEKHEHLVRRQLAGQQVFSAQAAISAKNFEMAHRLLDASGPEFGTPERRGFAWSYLRRVARDRLEILAGHDSAVNSLAVTADGRTLASGADRGEVRLWDLASGQSIALPNPREDTIHHLAFSLDGRRLAASASLAAGDILWEVPTRRLLGQLTDTKTVRHSAMLLSRDGNGVVAVRNQNTPTTPSVTCWDITHPVDFLPAATGQDATRIVQELVDESLQILAGLLDEPQPARIAVATLANLSRSLKERAPRGVALTRDSVMTLVAPGDGTFTLYHTATEQPLAVGRCDLEGITIVLPHNPVDERYTARDRQRLERWVGDLVTFSTASRSESHRVFRLLKRDLAVFNPARQEVAIWRVGTNRVSITNRLSIIDTTTGDEVLTYDLGEIDGVLTMCFTPDGATLALGTMDHKVRLWHLRPPPTTEVLRGHAPMEAWCLSFSPDGRTLASGGDDHHTRLWDLTTGQPGRVLRGQGALVSSVAFAPDGRTLASGSFNVDKPVIIWDVTTGESKFTLKDHAGSVRAVAFSPDGRTLASGGDDYTTMIWDTIQGVRTKTIPHRPRSAHCLAFSPDGRTVAVAFSLDRMILIDVVTGVIRSITTDTEVRSLTFSLDGSRLISGHLDGLITTWDVAEGRRVDTPLSGHSDIVVGLSLSPDGRTLASAGEDCTVRLWDTVTGQELLCLTDCEKKVNAVAFSPDGSTLAAADHSGAITIWRARR